MIWDANLPRYTSEDFAISSVMPEPPATASMVDWAWRYEDWHGHFERAEWEWGVSGRANQSPTQEPTRPGYEYPMPPLRRHGYTPLVMSAFARAGMAPYLSPRGINSRTNDGRPGCPSCGFCQSYGCAVNSRTSSVNTMLTRALRTGRCEIRTGHYAGGANRGWARTGNARGPAAGFRPEVRVPNAIATPHPGLFQRSALGRQSRRHDVAGDRISAPGHTATAMSQPGRERSASGVSIRLVGGRSASGVSKVARE
jgi:choline dehydrogenase-like flavoprotein